MDAWEVRGKDGRVLMEVSVVGDDLIKVNPVALRSRGNLVGASGSVVDIQLDTAAAEDLRMKLGAAIGLAQGQHWRDNPVPPVVELDPESRNRILREHGLGHLVNDEGWNEIGPDGFPTEDDEGE